MINIKILLLENGKTITVNLITILPQSMSINKP